MESHADQKLLLENATLLSVQRSLHLQRTRTAGGWLLYPIGLLSMLLAIGFGGLAAYLDPLWFANFGHIFGGIFLTAGLVGAVGAVVWTIGGLLALPEFIARINTDFEAKKIEAALSDSPRRYNFLHYMFEGLSLRSSLKLLLFVVPLVIILVLMQMTDLTSVLSNALLSGLTSLVGIPGLDFLSPLLTLAFVQGAVEMFCVLSPFILRE